MSSSNKFEVDSGQASFVATLENAPFLNAQTVQAAKIASPAPSISSPAGMN